MTNYNWSIQSVNSAKIETPTIIGKKYLRTLDALSEIDPVLSDWTISRSESSMDELLAWAESGAEEPSPVEAVPLEQARLDMTALVEANVQCDDWGEPQPDEGYSLVSNNQHNQTPRSVSVSVTAGSKFDFNRWSVDFGEIGRNPPDPSIITYPILGGAFRIMTSLWPTPWATVRGSNVEYADRPGVIGTTKVETSRHDITWMGYLSAELARGLAPPADLICERTSDGGLLMISSEERPDPDNADQMRRSDLLGAIMDKAYPDRS